jgi:hypothetical protein
MFLNPGRRRVQYWVSRKRQPLSAFTVMSSAAPGRWESEDLIPPQAGVSKDGRIRASWFETRAKGALLATRIGRTQAAAAFFSSRN